LPRPKKSFETNNINFKESFSSLKFVPRFFKEIRKVNPLLFYSNVIGRVLNAILPVIMLWLGKLVIDEVVAQIAAEGNSDPLMAISLRNRLKFQMSGRCGESKALKRENP